MSIVQMYSDSYRGDFGRALKSNKYLDVVFQEEEVKRPETPEEVLKEYEDEYPLLRFAVSDHPKGGGFFGMFNVIVHPDVLKRAAVDLEFAGRVKDKLVHLPSMETLKRTRMATSGMLVKSSGTYIAENGDVTSWLELEPLHPEDEDEEGKDGDRVQMEKHTLEKKELERLMLKHAAGRNNPYLHNEKYAMGIAQLYLSNQPFGITIRGKVDQGL